MGLLLSGMSWDASLQSAGDGEAVVSASASWVEELKFSWGWCGGEKEQELQIWEMEKQADIHNAK